MQSTGSRQCKLPALKQKSLATESLRHFLDSQHRRVNSEIGELAERKQASARRFDLLSNGAPASDVELYRNDYKIEHEQIQLEVKNRQRTLQDLELQRARLVSNEQGIDDLLDRAQETQDRIEDQDPVTLKNAYRELFEAVYVNLSPTDGVAVLTFVLRGHGASITKEENGSVGDNMVGAEGLEPPTLRL